MSRRLELLFQDLGLAANKKAPYNASLDDILMSIDDLQNQFASLQREYDKKVSEEIIPWIDRSIASAADCDWALRQFDTQWFAEQLFSSEQLSIIAKALLDATTPYIAPNDLWYNIANGDFSAVDDFEPEPATDDSDDLEDLKD